MIGSHVIRCCFGSTTLPSKSVTRTESFVRTAISRSPRKKTSRVCCEDRRDVGRDKELAVAEADDDRRPLANGDDRVRLVDRDDRQRKYAFEFLDSLSDRHLERQAFGIDVMPDQVGDDLGIGLGLERRALRPAGVP